LSALASEWLAEITGSAPRAIPSLSLLPEDARLGKQLVESLRGIRATQVVTVNFGVGGNAAKRISEEFETELVANLLGQRMRVVLDKGAGEEEVARADRIISRLRHASNEISVAEITEENLAEFHGDFDLVSWTGRIGLLASMIDASDLYIGYDSAGQHVAAALGTPCIDVFAGASSELFRRRWSPTGPAQTRVIEADGREAELALRETLDAGRELLQR
jgi:ADP-heptose:LPS heptosyltransferase